MKKILVVIGSYLPGTKAGGPVRSIANMIDSLSKEFEFFVVTSDKDLGDVESYKKIRYGEWNQVGKAKVWYVSAFTEEVVEQVSQGMDIVYLCGCFSLDTRIALNLKRKDKIHAKVIVAAMGLFSPGAFRIRRIKKTIFMWLMRLAGMFRKVEWSATDEDEIRNIQRKVGHKVVCYIARDLPAKVDNMCLHKYSSEGCLRIVFLSRISPKKNLKYAIEIVCALKGKIIFDIYGNMEDVSYFEQCQATMKPSCENIQICYKGAVSFDNVIEVLSRYDVFLFPTLGENYGHVIMEALQSRCIPVISDRTPWGELADLGIGNVIPLEKKQEFISCMQRYVRMGECELEKFGIRSYQYACSYNRNGDIQAYKEMFEAEERQ